MTVVDVTLIVLVRVILNEAKNLDGT